jgi:hypothetical protein
MNAIATEAMHLAEIELLQDDVLARLDELNARLEQLLAAEQVGGIAPLSDVA